MTRTIRRRRLESKTDYKTRLALLKSGKPRLVVRKTNKYVIAQIVETNNAQDKVVTGLTSKALLSKGWPKEKSGSLKSIPACYLTGSMLGNLAKSKIKDADIILDIGMHRNIQKSRIYAVLKGCIDAGLKIPHNQELMPSLEEIRKNKNINSIFDKLIKNM
nr:50S ribosomal protein L18P [uncultured archaeon]